MMGRHENGREQLGKYYNYFCFHIFYSVKGTGMVTPVGKTESDIRDYRNGIIQSGI